MQSNVQEVQENGGYKFEKVLATFIGNLQTQVAVKSDEVLRSEKELLLKWKSKIDEGLNFISKTLTEREQERNKRRTLAATLAKLLAVDPDMAQAFREKHRITEEELSEVIKVQPKSTRTSIQGKHVILEGDKVAYQNNRSAFEVFRAWAKKHAPAWIGEKDAFKFRDFLKTVCNVEKAESGLSWVWKGATWRYEVRE